MSWIMLHFETRKKETGLYSMPWIMLHFENDFFIRTYV